MDVFVRCRDGNNYPVEIQPKTTVADVKRAVEEQSELAAGTQRLFFDGVELTDGKQLMCETAIVSGDEIQCELRPLFSPGMKLEARDRQFPKYLCFASVVEVDGRRIKIHFDGWSAKYDYWTDDDTLDIGPVGTVESLGYFLDRPRGMSVEEWEAYRVSGSFEPAPVECFSPENVGRYFSNGPHKEPAAVAAGRIGLPWA
eukprot:TRINITY_DN2825_c0_g2_i3.p1 TRINITY_DN2825_c0_g2~~TRINITY_DN2825_c0_g2_i3.p1  ORF type:complete len:200 (+),score=39.29 TRINITY_DN2825_c0_g2_i3:86-685(+)